MRLPSLLATLVVLAVVATVLYLGIFLRLPFEKPLAYWPVDERTLDVVILDAPNATCEISQVVESNDAVRIHAQCLKRLIPLPQTGMAQKYVLRATLQARLGSRAVYDGLGNLAERCQLPGLDCVAPG